MQTLSWRLGRRGERRHGGTGVGWGVGAGVHHLHKIGVLGISDSDHSVHLLDQLLFLIIIKLHVPLGQARLARPVLDEDEADLGQREEEEVRGAGRKGQGCTHPPAPPSPTWEKRCTPPCCLPSPGPAWPGLPSWVPPTPRRAVPLSQSSQLATPGPRLRGSATSCLPDLGQKICLPKHPPPPAKQLSLEDPSYQAVVQVKQVYKDSSVACT